MKEKIIALLACPVCHGDLSLSVDHAEGDEIVSGCFSCHPCNKIYPIIRGIPRFVPLDNYSASFGFQWNKFKYTQVDCYSKTASSHQRFTDETGWDLDKLKNEWILDGGCGNGRFIEVASRSEADVVGVDLSNAIDAASELFKERKNVHLIQASLLQLPFRSGVFDKCYCIGVIQHTPNPEKVMRELPRVVKAGGDLAVTIYEKRKFTMLNAKYLFRSVTKKMNNRALLFSIQCAAPLLFPITEILYRIPVLSKLFQFTIPFANYVQDKRLTWRQRYEWAILDTFDMLSPAYDLPQKESDVKRYLTESSMREIHRRSYPGINITAIKAG